MGWTLIEAGCVICAMPGSESAKPGGSAGGLRTILSTVAVMGIQIVCRIRSSPTTIVDATEETGRNRYTDRMMIDIYE